MTEKNTKDTVLLVIKYLLVLLIVVFIAGRMTQNRQSSSPFSDVSAAVTASFSMDNVQEADNQMIKRLYGLDPNDYAGIELYYPTTNMGSEELLLVELREISQQDTVRTAMENRVQKQKDSFEGYAVEQYEMMENSIIEVRGNYLLLVVSDSPETTRAAFLKAL